MELIIFADKVRVLFLMLGLTIYSVAAGNAVQGKEDMVIFSGNKPAVSLDVSDDLIRSLNLDRSIQDFSRCFKLMTGTALPQTRKPAHFNPTGSDTERFECEVAQITNASKNVQENGTVALILSPTVYFEGSPLASSGEKVVWECTLQRGAKALGFRLIVAKEACYGPGYGPFTFANMSFGDTALAGKEPVTLCLEMRHKNGEDVRGGYSVNGKEWVYTKWFDPTRAGTDNRVPGVSDKNGLQGWGNDWPRRWANATGFFVTAYGAKDRAGQVKINRVTVSQSGKVIFRNDLSQKRWALIPRQGKVTWEGNTAILAPTPGSWSTVGLGADVARDNSGLVPIRVKLLAPPTGQEVFDARIVQGYEISVARNEIILYGHTRLGIQNALYSLLDRWGCRWVMIGKLGEAIPERKVLTLPMGKIQSPKCFQTAVQASGRASQDVVDWWNRNQGGFEYWMTGQHYWHHALPPKEYFKEHPEWYSLIGGKRVPRQLCTSNPEVIAKMIQVAKESLRSRPMVLSFPMDPNDDLDFCQCDKCRAQDPPGTNSFGQPLVTDRVVRFANEVARAIRSEFPGRVVAFYAYNNHTEPPVNVKPEKNVAVIITRSAYCLLHYLPDKRCPSTLEFFELVRRWGKMTSNLYLYDYDPISWTGCLPSPVYLDRAKELSILFKEYGIKGGHTDYVPHLTRAYASTYINTYIERRIKADPDRKPEDILSDLCRGFFGPAAEPMEKYYREMAKVTHYQHPDRTMVGAGLYRYEKLFNQAMIENARKYLNEAGVAATGRNLYQERIRFVDLSQQYLEAYLDGVWSAKAGDYTRTVAAFDRLERVTQKMIGINGIDPVDAPYRLNTAKSKTIAEYFPDKMHMIRTWKLLGPFNNDSRDADLRTDGFEPIASLDQPVKSSDGGLVRWTEYRSPEGLLNLETVLKGKTLPWKLSYMYAGATIESKGPRKVQFCMDSFCPFKVYLNGQEVYYRPGLDADSPDKRIVTVGLRKGTNIVVFKLSQTVSTGYSFPWGLYFRIKDLQGNPLKEF